MIRTAPYTLLLFLLVTACGPMDSPGNRAAATKVDKQTSAKDSAKKETAVEHAIKHLDPKYTCPMHPEIIRDAPGNCPICSMKLVKVKPQKESKVTINPTTTQNMGVETRGTICSYLDRNISTVGLVELDEDKISHIHMRSKGWIQNLRIKAKGERIKKNELMFEFYAPDLVNAQDELVQAIKTGNRGLIKASKDKLLSLGVNKIQIEEISKSRSVSQTIKVYAPHDGVATTMHAREGMYVSPRMRVLTLADLSSVWVQAEVFEAQSEWVAIGQKATVSNPYNTLGPRTGKVDYIYPSLNPKTRTLRIRLKFDNKDEKLKPNMYVNVSIAGQRKSNIVVIPSEALIRSGGETRVIVALGGGKYVPKLVKPGVEADNWIEIKNGLSIGDRVVTSSQFMIDSEASFLRSLNRLSNKGLSRAHFRAEYKNPVVLTEGVKVDSIGMYKKYDSDSGVITIIHDPVSKYGMSCGKRQFRIDNKDLIKQIIPHKQVKFTFEKRGNNLYVTKIKALDN